MYIYISLTNEKIEIEIEIENNFKYYRNTGKWKLLVKKSKINY